MARSAFWIGVLGLLVALHTGAGCGADRPLPAPEPADVRVPSASATADSGSTSHPATTSDGPGPSKSSAPELGVFSAVGALNIPRLEAAAGAVRERLRAWLGASGPWDPVRALERLLDRPRGDSLLAGVLGSLDRTRPLRFGFGAFRSTALEVLPYGGLPTPRAPVIWSRLLLPTTEPADQLAATRELLLAFGLTRRSDDVLLAGAEVVLVLSPAERDLAVDVFYAPAGDALTRFPQAQRRYRGRDTVLEGLGPFQDAVATVWVDARRLARLDAARRLGRLLASVRSTPAADAERAWLVGLGELMHELAIGPPWAELGLGVAHLSQESDGRADSGSLLYSTVAPAPQALAAQAPRAALFVEDAHGWPLHAPRHRAWSARLLDLFARPRVVAGEALSHAMGLKPEDGSPDTGPFRLVVHGSGATLTSTAATSVARPLGTLLGEPLVADDRLVPQISAAANGATFRAVLDGQALAGVWTSHAVDLDRFGFLAVDAVRDGHVERVRWRSQRAAGATAAPSLPRVESPVAGPSEGLACLAKVSPLVFTRLPTSGPQTFASALENARLLAEPFLECARKDPVATELAERVLASWQLATPLLAWAAGEDVASHIAADRACRKGSADACDLADVTRPDYPPKEIEAASVDRVLGRDGRGRAQLVVTSQALYALGRRVDLGAPQQEWGGLVSELPPNPLVDVDQRLDVGALGRLLSLRSDLVLRARGVDGRLAPVATRGSVDAPRVLLRDPPILYGAGMPQQLALDGLPTELYVVTEPAETWGRVLGMLQRGRLPVAIGGVQTVPPVLECPAAWAAELRSSLGAALGQCYLAVAERTTLNMNVRVDALGGLSAEGSSECVAAAVAGHALTSYPANRAGGCSTALVFTFGPSLAPAPAPGWIPRE